MLQFFFQPSFCWRGVCPLTTKVVFLYNDLRPCWWFCDKWDHRFLREANDMHEYIWGVWDLVEGPKSSVWARSRRSKHRTYYTGKIILKLYSHIFWIEKAQLYKNERTFNFSTLTRMADAAKRTKPFEVLNTPLLPSWNNIFISYYVSQITADIFPHQVE